jgi:hypothetical protein
LVSWPEFLAAPSIRFLGLGYCGMGVLVSGYGLALRIASVLLVLCAVFGLITTALMTVTSVIADHAGLCVECRSQLMDKNE